MINLDFISPGESTLSPGESTLGPGESTFSSGESTQKSSETSSGEWVIGRNDLIPFQQIIDQLAPERSGYCVYPCPTELFIILRVFLYVNDRQNSVIALFKYT